MKNTPHTWSRVIAAWEYGTPIQFRVFKDNTWSNWVDCSRNCTLNWDDPNTAFRIKPRSYNKKLGWH